MTTGTESIPETLDTFHPWTQMSGREHFIEW